LLFRSGIISFLIASLVDVAVAWALYIVLKPVNKNLSLLAAWFRLGYAVMFAVALQDLIGAVQLLSGADYLGVFQTSQLNAQVMQMLDTFNTTWDIALVAFGIHLVLIGYLVFKSTFIPRVVGVFVGHCRFWLSDTEFFSISFPGF
jgi:Domain of unknown function (DUF4386)